MRMMRRLKASLFPKGLSQEVKVLRNRFLRRVTRRRLRDDLTRMGIGAGDVVCVHSRLSAIGFVPGGAETVVRVLRDHLGREGTLMVPTFSVGNSTLEYVRSGPPPFDPATSPLTTGQVAEIASHAPGAVRSVHPTHSVAAIGPLAADLTGGHHLSATPFGPGSPYDRLIERGGKMLLVGVNANSLLHTIEERVGWPNEYLEEPFPLPVRREGRADTLLVKVHQPGPTHHVLFPSRIPGVYRFLLMPNFALPFIVDPSLASELERIDPDALRAWRERKRSYEERGIVRIGRIGDAVSAVIDARRFAEAFGAELGDYLARQGALHEPSKLRDLFGRTRESDAAPLA